MFSKGSFILSCSICKGRHHSALCEQGNANSTACKDVGKANTNTCVESVECGGRVALQTTQGYVNGTRSVNFLMGEVTGPLLPLMLLTKQEFFLLVRRICVFVDFVRQM